MMQTGKYIAIKISEKDYEAAKNCGRRRLNEALARGLKRTAQLPGENSSYESMLADHVLGAAGEIAYARLTEQEWAATVNTYRSGSDVGEVQVRTRSRSHYDLNIKAVDAKAHENENFVLMLGTHGGRDFVAVGWIGCVEAQRDEWLKTHGGGRAAWFVPKSALRPFPVGSEPSEEALLARKYTICPCCGAGMTAERFGGTIIFVCQRGSAGETRCRGRQIAERLAEPSTQALLIEGQRWP